jgi:Transposase DNA-binding/Transposase Tn5 dimerisation domain
MEHDIATWAEATWGNCALGNAQRTKRAIAVGVRMAAQPGASLPAQMGSRAMLKGAYRLLNCPAIGLEELWRPHHEATRQAATHYPTVLFIQDWTTLDYSHHPQTAGIGPVGSRRQRGMLLHSVLAYAVEAQEVLGLAYGKVIVRSEGGTGRSAQHNGGRRSLGGEGRVWEEAAEAIGSASGGSRWIHVSDRESDVFEYMAVCKRLGKEFVLRAFHDRKLEEGGSAAEARSPAGQYLMQLARQLRAPTAQTYAVEVAATSKKGKAQPSRRAQICLAWTPLHMPAPSYVKGHAGLEIWLVRAWEPAPPAGAEAVEWILLTSLRVTTWAEARYLTQLYECRWLVEDYHMCLKTGCRLEASQLDHGHDLQRLLGFTAPLAVRLLQLRHVVRTAPQVPARTAVDPLLVQLLAAKFNLPVRSLTITQFWARVAQLGGHLGRKSDGPPGWRTLWKGWRHLSDWAEGVRLLVPQNSG